MGILANPRLPTSVAAAVAGIVLLAVWPLAWHGDFLIYIATLVLQFSIGACSLQLIIRTGHISLSHAAFAGIGGYASVLLVMRAGWPWHFALIPAILLPAAFGAIIGPILLRLTGKYFVLVTFLFGELMRFVATDWQSVTGGSNGIFGIPRPYPSMRDPLNYYWLSLAAAVVCVGLCVRIMRSEIGRAMDSMRESERLTECAGVPVFRLKVIVFIIACGMAGVQGSLNAHMNNVITPGNFGPMESLNLVVMNVIGGMTNVGGALLGTVFLVALPELLRGYVEWQRVFYGIILIVVMAFLPGGIVELWSRVRALWTGRAVGIAAVVGEDR
jgi:branched-chain amino acid transport system permease protein